MLLVVARPTSIQRSFELARDTAILDRLPLAAPADPGPSAQGHALFRENPAHPSLQFKKVADRGPVYAVRVTLDYRALGVLTGPEVLWFWIGSHADYDRLLPSL